MYACEYDVFIEQTPVCWIHFDFTGPNIALQKQTQQSSAWNNGTSDKAVDGRRENEWVPQCVYIPKDYTVQWWRVDLGAEYTITGVKIYNVIRSGM